MNEKILVNAIPTSDGYSDLAVEITMSAKIEEMLKTLKEQMHFDSTRYSMPFMEVKVPLSVKVFESWQVKDDYLEEDDYFGGQVVDQFPEVSGIEMDVQEYTSCLVVAKPIQESGPSESSMWIKIYTKQEGEDICCESPVNYLSEYNWNLWYGKPNQTKKGKQQ